MASGFKGTVIQLYDIRVEGGDIGFGAKFVAPDDGLVHATVQHRIPYAENPEIAKAVRELNNVLRAWTERAHFTGGSVEAPQKVVISGIAEAISGGAREGLQGIGGTQQGGD